MARTEEETDELQAVHQVGQVGLVQEPGPEFGESVAKRFCEKSYNLETEREKRLQEDANKRFVEPGQQPVLAPYPHSMPASPTMFDARSVPQPLTQLVANIAFVFRNINSLGILRHFARVGSSENNVEVPREAHENSRNGEHQVLPSSHPIDYRFQPTEQSEV